MGKAKGSRPTRRDGIRAETEFLGARWWTEEWLDHIHKLSSTQKLIAAAKSCVKAGAVLEVSIEAGVVESKVQGRRKTPYQVRLYCELPTEEQLEGIKRRLSEKAITGAMLLSGDMPLAVKEAFSAEGVALMPNDFIRGRRLCSCPDQERVCKHILAVLFVTVDVIDRDPLMILKLRGLDRDTLLSSLLAPRGDSGAAPVLSRDCRDGGPMDNEPSGVDPGDDEPLPMDASFYGSEELAEALLDFWNNPSQCASFPDPHTPILHFPLWKGETTFSDSIEQYYESVRKALRGKRATQ
ncbi:MAG: hypothetical protein LBQ19_06325 [Synergistaceae bacterium]|jgi:uncharacterized Zn finger protein|nr:hypothetical protein [Synergistaceae bacterium]